MFAKVDTFGLTGLSAFSVKAESSTEKGTPDFRITGLGDASIQESRQRVLAAMENSGFSTDKLRAVVNLYPADIKKSGFLLRPADTYQRAYRPRRHQCTQGRGRIFRRAFSVGRVSGHRGSAADGGGG